MRSSVSKYRFPRPSADARSGQFPGNLAQFALEQHRGEAERCAPFSLPRRRGSNVPHQSECAVTVRLRRGPVADQEGRNVGQSAHTAIACGCPARAAMASARVAHSCACAARTAQPAMKKHLGGEGAGDSRMARRSSSASRRCRLENRPPAGSRPWPCRWPPTSRCRSAAAPPAARGRHRVPRTPALASGAAARRHTNDASAARGPRGSRRSHGGQDRANHVEAAVDVPADQELLGSDALELDAACRIGVARRVEVGIRRVAAGRPALASAAAIRSFQSDGPWPRRELQRGPVVGRRPVEGQRGIRLLRGQRRLRGRVLASARLPIVLVQRFRVVVASRHAARARQAMKVVGCPRATRWPRAFHECDRDRARRAARNRSHAGNERHAAARPAAARRRRGPPPRARRPAPSPSRRSPASRGTAARPAGAREDARSASRANVTRSRRCGRVAR